MAIAFCPLASGSSGNCTFIGTEYTKVLIDTGLSGVKVENALQSIGVDARDLSAIFITHEHSDHVGGAGVLSRRYNLPIYATEGTWNGMAAAIGKIGYSNRNILYDDQFVIINELCVKPFEIPHDANEPVGYNVTCGDIKMSVATDIGHITNTVRQSIVDSDILLLEANHDIEMLQKGPYPYPLKRRILGDNGHLANIAAGNLIAQIISDKMRHIYLGHLSEENNTPELAYKTVADILKENDINVNLYMADRFTASKVTRMGYAE